MIFHFVFDAFFFFFICFHIRIRFSSYDYRFFRRFFIFISPTRSLSSLPLIIRRRCRRLFLMPISFLSFPDFRFFDACLFFRFYAASR